MKMFKQIEFYCNIILIVTLTVWCLIEQSFERRAEAYMITGAVQVSGMAVHRWNGWFTAKWSKRWVYHWITFILLLLFTTGFSFYFLGITAPVFAIYYTFICWKELQALQLKAFVHLK